MNLSEFTNSLQLTPERFSVETAMIEYHRILRENEENHDEIDHWTANSGNYTIPTFKKFWFQSQYYLNCYFVLILYFAANLLLIYSAYLISFGW